MHRRRDGCDRAPGVYQRQASPAGASLNGQQLAAQHHRIAQRIMHRREKAVHDKDERSFLATLDRSNTAMVRRQKMQFENLVEMPLQVFTLDALDATWPSDFASARFQDTAYIPYVQQRLQLRGFDPLPVVTTTGVDLARVHGRWRSSPTTTSPTGSRTGSR